MGERSTGAEEKRRLILDAAVRVFAHKGFHTSRVGDIAEEAGVAHGLLYHYFSSKDEVLETIFRETWGQLLADIQEIEDSGASAREQLQQATVRLLGSWQRDPDVVRVIVREIARSPAVQARIVDLVKPVEAVQRMIAYGQETGEFRSDFDARLAGIAFYGGIEELLSGWVLGQIPDGAEVVAAAERTVLDVGLAGFTATPTPPVGV
ncbi:MAG: TetR/AcrR family transcriptional regulator, fatty acid metabolism regulator protein [Actinomycetota bacterium]